MEMAALGLAGLDRRQEAQGAVHGHQVFLGHPPDVSGGHLVSLGMYSFKRVQRATLSVSPSNMARKKMESWCR